MKLAYICIYLLQLFFIHNIQANQDLDYDERLYKQLFKRRRADQLEAIKGFKRFNNYEKQVSMVLVLAKKIFDVIDSSRVLLEASDYLPGHSDFPKDEKISEGLSNILENTALFSEIVLRFPDISERTLKDNNEWLILFQWSIGFSQLSSNLLDKGTITLLNLVSQELNLIPRDPKYKNPYRKVPQEVKYDKDPIEVKGKKKRKEIKKGPRLGGRTDL